MGLKNFATNPVSSFGKAIGIKGNLTPLDRLDAIGTSIKGASSIGKVNADLSLINKVGYNPQLYQMMLDRAMGNNSLAAAQATATGQQNINQAMAMAASARGLNPATAFRSAQLQAGDMAAQTQQNAMLGRLQESQQATQQVGDYQKFYDELRAKQEMAQLQAQTDASKSTQENRVGIFSGIMGGLGNAMSLGGASGMFSDKNKKENISYDPKEVEKMFSKLKSATYEYKDKEDGEGKYAGVMAQDLEKSKVGKDMVKDTPDGKKVDLAKMLFALTAQVNNMNKKLEKMKG